MNSAPVRWSSGGKGFVLSDALIAVVIVALLALLTQRCVMSAVHTKRILEEAAAESDAEYEDFMRGIGECVCEEETPEETPEDISSNSS
ncbi:MAG: hypothetical protein IKE28_05220 [Solobacterium sp.]|nr:hypothetical protein [Solobacterium sp.]MBR3393746.1 hypothetical protein [Bacillota bacterium]